MYLGVSFVAHIDKRFSRGVLPHVCMRERGWLPTTANPRADPQGDKWAEKRNHTLKLNCAAQRLTIAHWESDQSTHYAIAGYAALYCYARGAVCYASIARLNCASDSYLSAGHPMVIA
jgi:hypothetical protein